MRSLLLLAPLTVVSLAAWYVLGETTPSTAPATPMPIPARTTPRFQGAVSCSASACHNANDFRQTKGSEYSIWVTRDRHSQAYATMFKAESKDMVRKLGLGPAHLEQRCLACHGFEVPPDLRGEKLVEFLSPEERVTPILKESVREGVSCEQCHGASEDWRTTHYLTAISRNGSEQHAKGMTATKDLAERVRACASCHIGDESHEVNHDLIAAGHPRLLFEYTAYHDLMPRHWFEGGPGTDFEVRAWLIGQIASARAAVKLLQIRAKRAAINDKRAIWPEFAETSCFACHHDLQSPSWRQRRTFDGRKPGEMPWNGWYVAMPKALLRIDAPVSKPAGVDAKMFDDLTMLMRRPSPNPEAVTKATQAILGQLDEWLKQLAKDPGFTKDPATIDRLLRDLLADATEWSSEPPTKTSEGILKNIPDWEHAAQAYLGVSALHLAQNDLQLKARSRRLPQRQDELRKFLEFGSQYNSPKGFTPNQFYEKLRGIGATEQ